MIRVVLDTNVLLSTVIRPGGKPDQILRQLPGRFELLASEFILSELNEIVTRRHIQAKYKDQVTAPKWALFTSRLRLLATMVEVKSDLRGVVSDPDDEAVLVTAVDGEAAYLVTGDRHLLKLKEYERVRILTPEEFLQVLRQ
jgi:uncharacterized protein